MIEMAMQKTDFFSFLSGPNGEFVQSLYDTYQLDPTSIDASWKTLFDSLSADDRLLLTEGNGHPAPAAPMPAVSVAASAVESAVSGASSQPDGVVLFTPLKKDRILGKTASPSNVLADDGAKKSAAAARLIDAYRQLGHVLANLDPLGLDDPKMPPELDPKTYGFDNLMDPDLIFVGAFGLECAPIRQILDALFNAYCGSVGFDYMHLPDYDAKIWIKDHIEVHQQNRPSYETRFAILTSLAAAVGFEKFLQTKYPSAKRFGLEGGESTILSLETLLSVLATGGVRDVVLGMAHRGRLNVLTNIIGKKPRAIFSEFQGDMPFDGDQSGDVKYHLGASGNRQFGEKIVHVSLAANPSHLEFVNPVVIGKVRAKQKRRGDRGRDEVLGILIHGDASFAGQGVVPETLSLSELPGYETGGTIHIIINNQIGFTTSPQNARSSRYCSDVAKTIGAPIFHVNGDDVEAVVFVSQLAAQYRTHFKKDVIIDLVCYRRNGHNEMDEPNFTQPIMYQTIAALPRVDARYADILKEEGVISPFELDKIASAVETRLQGEFDASKDYRPENADWLSGAWVGLDGTLPPDGEPPLSTGVGFDVLAEIGAGLARVPDGFTLHPKLVKVMENRQAMATGNVSIDWAGAEALAFSSLLLEETPVRLSGQDSPRGTFSQRHARVVDQKNGMHYVPMNHIRIVQQDIEVVDSPLSEAAVLGFEHGYTLSDPSSLVLWEAQFGDFANGAQVIIDQFIAASTAKWLRLSGLVLLLPHGYEGQGPEHSSARLERFLQLSAEENIQVVNPTTPANYFHVLRRQIHRKTRKPLIVMAPKSLLRNRDAVSDLNDIGPGTGFRAVLPDNPIGPKSDDDIRRVLLCSGKVYYDLCQEREKRGRHDVAIIRVEQLYPFPSLALASELMRYPGAEILWCQEEHANMGAWTFMDRRIESILTAIHGRVMRPGYAGRGDGASTAAGSQKRHWAEYNAFIEVAFNDIKK